MNKLMIVLLLSGSVVSFNYCLDDADVDEPKSMGEETELKAPQKEEKEVIVVPRTAKKEMVTKGKETEEPKPLSAEEQIDALKELGITISVEKGGPQSADIVVPTRDEKVSVPAKQTDEEKEIDGNDEDMTNRDMD